LTSRATYNITSDGGVNLSYRIGVEDAGSYVHLFITYFNTITNQFWLKLLFPVPVISHLKL